jgi:hypothetical protein
MEKDELKHIFDEYIDRCLMECAVLNLAWIYEEEEQELLLWETRNKVERDTVKQRTDMAKMGLREVEEAIERGAHPHFKETPKDYDYFNNEWETMGQTHPERSTIRPDPVASPGAYRDPEKSIWNKQLDQSSRLNQLFN